MNVLIFVMSMLMIFVLMTYARLDTYRSMAGIEGEFTRYMEAIERTYINMSADKFYDRISFKKDPQPAPAMTPSEKKDETVPEQPPEKPKGKSNGRLSLHLLVNAKAREADPKGYKETMHLLKELINTLYVHQKQFQALMEKRPTMVDEIIDKIPHAVAALPQNIKISRAADLSNLELGDGLDEPFYLMLKGCPSIKPATQIVEISDKAEDNAEDAEEADEFTSDKAYDSLLNFIDLHHSLRINIYIASRPLLMAIYGDPATVDNVIKTRFELYKSVEHSEIQPEEASEKLKNEFQVSGEAGLFDYKVTGSDPRRYD